MSEAGKYVYSFGGGKADGKAEMKSLLGGKGANLAEMSVIGIPVPPGFTITTEVCAAYYENGKKLPEALKPQVRAAIEQVEKQIGARLGDPSDPLLVSVRSGAALSMPGMMNTILNLGLTDAYMEVDGAAGGYTFWDYQAGAWQRNHGIRIDHLLLSPQAADHLGGVTIHKSARAMEKPSDHVPVSVELNFDG